MTISPLQLMSILEANADFLLLDVREEWEFAEYNIGGLNIPLNDLPFRLMELHSWRQKKVVVQCKTGNRGKTGTKFLRKNGFSEAENLQGGITAFMAAYPGISFN